MRDLSWITEANAAASRACAHCGIRDEVRPLRRYRVYGLRGPLARLCEPCVSTIAGRGFTVKLDPDLYLDFRHVAGAAFTAKALGYRDDAGPVVFAWLREGILHTAPSARELTSLTGAP